MGKTGGNTQHLSGETEKSLKKKYNPSPNRNLNPLDPDEYLKCCSFVRDLRYKTVKEILRIIISELESLLILLRACSEKVILRQVTRICYSLLARIDDFTVLKNISFAC
jgi:hypothetical protein